MKKLDQVLEKLKEVGLKITGPRKLILKTMLEHHGPFQADEIFAKISKNGIDRVTIYRTIQTLSEMGLLNTIFISPGVSHYEFEIDHKHHHHHIICKKCKKIDPIDVCVTVNQQKSLEKLGYTHISHKLEFYGLCSSCS
jgi:Fur family ferric uptake transcriptional regulator